MFKIEILQLPNGREPYKEWIEKLSINLQVKIAVYLRRIVLGGSKKNIRHLSDGLFEIKLKFKPGIRVYFGYVDEGILLLLCGGDKSTQSKDIKKAKKYWRDYVQNKLI